MTERKQGHSKLVYDKETRTIKTVDPHPAALAATPADVLERIAREQSSDPATDDLTVPLAIELSEMTSRAFKAEAALRAATPAVEEKFTLNTPMTRFSNQRPAGEPEGTWSDGGKVWEGEPATPAVDDLCQCPKCGRMHRNLGFGRPPGSHVPVTLAELEALLAEPDRPVEILLDGTVRPLVQPAPPRELLDAAQKVVMRYPYVTEKEALEIAKAVLALAQPASPLRGPDEWHWRTLDDEGKPTSKWFVVDGPLEDFKKDMETDPCEFRPLFASPEAPVGFVSVELLNIERAVSDDLRERNAKLRSASPLRGSEWDHPTASGLVAERNSSSGFRIGPASPPEQPAKWANRPACSFPEMATAAPVTGRDGLKAVYVKRWRTIFLVPEGIADDVRITLAMLSPKEATWHQEPSDDEKIDHAEQVLSTSGAQDKRGPSTSGSPVWPGGTSDDLDIEPIEGAKP